MTRLTKNDAICRTHKALAILALGLALVGATTTAAAAAAPTGTPDLADQRKALYQSELERNLATAPAADRAAIQPTAPTGPAAPSPGVDVLATLLVGLVGALVGGGAAMAGWTAATRRRVQRAASVT